MKKIILMTLLAAAPTLAAAQTEPAAPAKTNGTIPLKVGYSKKGTEFATEDGRFAAALQWRIQLRYNFSYDDEPRTANQFDQSNDNAFRVRRGRIKLAGHAYDPALKYKFEYDWPSSLLLDSRLSIEKYKELSLHVGQWKIDYNRERVDSSGNQQLADRSIVNRDFTVDRQTGAELYGHLFRGTPGDSRYWVGVFTGAGANAANDDAEMMYLARYQWNVFGRDLAFSQSDVEHHEKPTGSLAAAALTDQTNGTRFSGTGIGNLDGFAAGGPGRFTLKQWMGEASFKWRGFSFQHEYHWKQVRDNTTDALTRMQGAYWQTGYFPHYAIEAVPQPLEVALRYAFVDPNVRVARDIRREYSAAVNWFFAGHNNKITLEGTHFELARAGGLRSKREERVRLQWDVSF